MIWALMYIHFTFWTHNMDQKVYISNWKTEEECQAALDKIVKPQGYSYFYECVPLNPLAGDK